MPIDVSWHNEPEHILRWDAHGAWTIEEFYAALDETRRLSTPYQGKASVIVYAEEVTKRPSSSLLLHFRNALRDSELDTVVYVRNRGGAMMIEVMVNTVIRLNSELGVKQFKFARTLEEAEAFFSERTTS